MMDWKPIDEAPRNPGDIGDSWLIGFNPAWNTPIPICWFWHGWVTPDQAVQSYGEEGDGLYRVLPTHWLPMPSPPSLPESGR